MKEKHTLILIAALLIICIFAASAGCIAEKEHVNVIIKIPTHTCIPLTDPDCRSTTDFIDKAWKAFAEQYTKYDVHADIITFEQTEHERNIQDCYGTKKAADLIVGGYNNFASFIHDGYAVPLDDVITDELRNDVSPSFWKISQAENGKTYLLPFFCLENILSYNKDLFRQAGLEKYISDKVEIQNWTLEEWEDILDTLAEKLPQGCYPYLMYAKNNQGDAHVLILLRANGADVFDESGHFNMNTPEGIASLKWISDGNAKGWYPKHAEILEILDNQVLFNNNQLAFYIFNSGFVDTVNSKDMGFVNFPSADGKGLSSVFIEGFMAFDNGDAKKLEVVKDFISYIYANKEWRDYASAGIPCLNSVANEYGPQIFLGEAFAKNAERVVDYTGNNPNWVGVRAAFYPVMHDLLSGRLTPEKAAEAIDKNCNAAIDEGYKNSILHE
ncbi:MAG TPA: extracellular solute-binding protein [Methanocorpusculum sp.]|nr:extracellular solute-binding protein [Methanocorpusculum sp.]